MREYSTKIIKHVNEKDDKNRWSISYLIEYGDLGFKEGVSYCDSSRIYELQDAAEPSDSKGCISSKRSSATMAHLCQMMLNTMEVAEISKLNGKMVLEPLNHLTSLEQMTQTVAIDMQMSKNC